MNWSESERREAGKLIAGLAISRSISAHPRAQIAQQLSEFMRAMGNREAQMVMPIALAEARRRIAEDVEPEDVHLARAALQLLELAQPDAGLASASLH